MEQIYTVLQTNLTELDKEINSEFLKLKSEDQTQIRKDNELRIEANQTIVINKDQRIQELEEQIANEEKELKLLINSVNEKLESKKKFVSSNEKAKITQERHQLFEQFLTTGFIDSKLKSMSEDKKINLSEITNLQNSIKNSREQLNSYQLENQVVQLEINKL